MMLTDPPYNVDVTGCTKDLLKIKNDAFAAESDFEEFLFSALSTAESHVKEGGSIYIWLASMHLPAFASAMQRAGFLWKQVLVWAKNTFVIGRQDYQWRHELCLYGWKPGAAHHFVDSRRESTVYEDAKPDPEKMKKSDLIEMVNRLTGEKVSTDVLHFDKPSASEKHPTMKPVKLFAYLIRNSSRQGDTIFDPFGGSGTTLIAAEQLGRTCYMMELDPHYCEVILQRWENMTGQKAEKIA